MNQQIEAGWDVSGHEGCEEREACDNACCGRFTYQDGTPMRCCDVAMDPEGKYWDIGCGMAFREAAVALLASTTLIFTRVEGIHSIH